MEHMSSAEKEKFLYELRWDPVFRNEILEGLSESIDMRSEIVDKAMRECENQLESQTEKFIEDASDAVYDDIMEKVLSDFKEEVIDKVIENVQDKIINVFKEQMSDNKSGLKESIVCSIVEQLASECLNLGEKEKLKKKVHQEMINKRSFRGDLLDLDLDDE